MNEVIKKRTGTDSFMDVELFLIANGRLPNEETDSLTYEMVKKVCDKAMLKRDPKAIQILNYAFHRLHMLGPNYKGD